MKNKITIATRLTILSIILFLFSHDASCTTGNTSNSILNNNSNENELNIEQIDSLSNLLNQNLSNKELMKQLVIFYNENPSITYPKLLFRAGKFLVDKKKYQKALIPLKATLDLKQTKDYDDLLINTYLLISESYNEERLPDSAALFLNRAEEIYTEQKKQGYLAIILNQRATIADLKGESPEAISIYQKVVDIYLQQNKNTNELAEVYSKISILHTTLRNYDDAALYMDKAINTCETNQLNKALVGYYINRGTLEHEFGHFLQARPWFDKALTFAKNYGTNYDLAALYANIGNLENVLKNYSRSAAYYDSSRVICINENISYGIFINTVNMGVAYLDAGQTNKAFQYLSEAEIMIEENNYREEKMNLNLVLSDYYQKENNYKAAYDRLITYNTLKDSIQGESTRNKIIELEKKYQKEKAEKEIISLNETLYHQKSRNRKYIIFLLLILLLSAGIGVYMYYSRKMARYQSRFAEQELEKSQMEVQIKNQELMGKALNLARLNEVFSEFKKESRNLISELPKVRANEAHRNLKRLERKFPDAAWKEFEFRFEQVHSEYNTRLLDKYPELTAAELKICNFIILNLTTKDIAALTNRSKKTIDNTRNSIRKKMNLDREDNLMTILLAV